MYAIQLSILWRTVSAGYLADLVHLIDQAPELLRHLIRFHLVWQFNRGFSKPFAKGLAKKVRQKQFVMEFFNLSINKITCDFYQIFLLDNRYSVQFCMFYQIKSNVHLLYSFYHKVFLVNVLPNLWQKRLEKHLV